MESLRDTLDAHGYRTFTALDPVHAQELFHKMSDAIDLVITDMHMPHMNGVELSRQLNRIKSGVNVIGMSGTREEGDERENHDDIEAFIEKPFNVAKLLSTVRQVLNDESSDRAATM